MRVDCALLTIHSSLNGSKQTVDAWNLSILMSMALIDSLNLVPVNQVLTITGTVPDEKHN